MSNNTQLIAKLAHDLLDISEGDWLSLILKDYNDIVYYSNELIKKIN